MSKRALVLAALLCAALLPAPALAIRCSTWERLSYENKWAMLQQMTEDALRSGRTQKYRIHRLEVARCIDEHADTIIDDFDYICSLGQRASLSALNRQFKDWAWSCIP